MELTINRRSPSTSSMDATPTSTTGASGMPSEQIFLETYFQYLSKFAYDRAKEITEKEREMSKANASLLWSSLLNLLNTLAASEKTFCSLVFLSYNFGSRLLGRKDTLRTTYSCLLTEMKKIEKAHVTVAVPSGTNTFSLEQLIAGLCGDLQHFVTARIKAIGFYEQMVAFGSSRNVSYEDLLGVVTEISSGCNSVLQHPLLVSLKSSFSLECECITCLLQAQINLQSCQYLPSLLNLYNAHAKLALWASLLSVKDAKKLGFVSAPKPWSPALYEWMIKYESALVSKFSLYFYEVLCKQGPPQEVKTLASKTCLDFYSKISGFQKKYDAFNISLILNTQDLKDGPFAGLGYHLSKSSNPVEGGHGGYYAIFSCPNELSSYHWKRVYHLLIQKHQELDAAADKPVYRCDEGQQFNATYFMIRTDPLITLLLVFETKRVERDSNIASFLTTVAAELRCTKLFMALRPGHK